MSATAARILVVDDDEGHARALADGLEADGYDCRIVGSGGEAVVALGEERFDAVLTDLVMHDRSGLDVLKESKRAAPDTPVLLVTGHATVETAVDAMREGAEDYLSKPVKLRELRAKLAKAVERARLVRDNQALRDQNVELKRQFNARFGFEGILGRSPEMVRLFDVLSRVSPTDVTVLVLGESGTGKELVARAIHANSRRSAGNFVAVNCAALTEGLIESELFGHVKGAFTGAIAEKEGRIAYADGGTLFLDEVGDMPLATQAKLLRVLETREVVQVGGNASRRVDIRLVAATNRDLESMVAEGTFREDLFHRLQVVSIELPPLRYRVSDLPYLVDHFLAEFGRAHARAVTGITPEARAVLSRYPWPGNVRELRNTIENMVLLARGEVLGIDDLPERVRRVALGGDGTGRDSRRDGGARSPVEGGADGHDPRAHGAGELGPGERGSRDYGPGEYVLVGRTIADVERDMIRVNLEHYEGNRKRTAEALGIGERTLYRKIKEYEL